MIRIAVTALLLIIVCTGCTEQIFPLLVAAYDENGRDYVGVLTLPFGSGNAVLWYLFPYILLCIWASVVIKFRNIAKFG